MSKTSFYCVNARAANSSYNYQPKMHRKYINTITTLYNSCETVKQC